MRMTVISLTSDKRVEYENSLQSVENLISVVAEHEFHRPVSWITPIDLELRAKIRKQIKELPRSWVWEDKWTVLKDEEIKRINISRKMNTYRILCRKGHLAPASRVLHQIFVMKGVKDYGYDSI